MRLIFCVVLVYCGCPNLKYYEIKYYNPCIKFKDRLQIMNEFQAAQRKRLEEPAADVGLEPFCAMVCLYTCRILCLTNSSLNGHRKCIYISMVVRFASALVRLAVFHYLLIASALCTCAG